VKRAALLLIALSLSNGALAWDVTMHDMKNGDGWQYECHITRGDECARCHLEGARR